MTDDSIEIDIRPEVNILSVLSHLNYKPWFALAEFVDNSLASFLEAKSAGFVNADQPLKVDISIDLAGTGRIVIKDNAFGISAKDFPRAFRAAEVPPDRTGLSEFGMGMKSAASWFARKWTVRTSVLGEPRQRQISFNLADIVANQTQTLKATDTPAAPDSHFTVVELLELNHLPKGRAIPKIKSHLASIYRQFLRRGDLVLTLNDAPIEYKEVDVLEAPPAWAPETPAVIWQKEISIDLGGGKSIDGFTALRAVGSTAEAGLALFRRDRLILGSFDEPYRPTEIFKRSNSYVYQRLFGELHLTGFDVSHTKDGFRWDDVEDDFLESLIEQLVQLPLNLIRQAADYRVAVPEPDEREPIEDATSAVGEVFKDRLQSAVRNATVNPYADAFISDHLAGDVGDSVQQSVRVETDEGVWVIDLRAILDDAQSDWIDVGADFAAVGPDGQSETHLDVTVNLAHPFSRRYAGPDGQNTEVLVAVASIVGTALALSKRAGARTQFMLAYLNSLLRSSFEVLGGEE